LPALEKFEEFGRAVVDIFGFGEFETWLDGGRVTGVADLVEVKSPEHVFGKIVEGYLESGKY
jgi:hypothetical protein